MRLPSELRSEHAAVGEQSTDRRGESVSLALTEDDLEQIRAALGRLADSDAAVESVELLALSLDVELQNLISRARTADGALTVEFDLITVELMALAYLHACRSEAEPDDPELSPQLGLELFSSIRTTSSAPATVALQPPTPL